MKTLYPTQLLPFTVIAPATITSQSSTRGKPESNPFCGKASCLGKLVTISNFDVKFYVTESLARGRAVHKGLTDVAPLDYADGET